jgi:hypothetical protein
MQCPFVLNTDATAQAQCKPHLITFDSSEECSLTHLEEVFRIVEIAEFDDHELKGYLFDDSCLLISE